MGQAQKPRKTKVGKIYKNDPHQCQYSWRRLFLSKVDNTEDSIFFPTERIDFIGPLLSLLSKSKDASSDEWQVEFYCEVFLFVSSRITEKLVQLSTWLDLIISHFRYTLIKSSMFTVRNSNYSCEAILFSQSKWMKNVSFAVFVKIKRVSGPSPLTTPLKWIIHFFPSNSVKYRRKTTFYHVIIFAIRIMSVVEKIINHWLPY